MSSQLVKKLVIDAARNKFKAAIFEKNKKKGILTKLMATNHSRTSKLVDILSDAETQATMSKKRPDLSQDASDNEYLKTYYKTPKGGPNHTIATNRAHHLTKFLRQYLLNAFQSGQFLEPEIPNKFKKTVTIDSNGFARPEYNFSITNVELPADLSKLKIFWSNSGVEELDLAIEHILDSRLKSQIRSQLTNQRVMNYVPNVVFVRDAGKLMYDQLDEMLMKVKIERENSNPSDKDVEDVVKVEEFSEMAEMEKKDSIDNLYGVDYNHLMDVIRKNSDHVPWSPETTDVKVPETSRKELVPNGKSSGQEGSNKFQVSLKNYQIHQRQRTENLSRRAILMIETQNFKSSLDF